MQRIPVSLKVSAYRAKNQLMGWLNSIPERIYFIWKERPLPNTTILLAGSGRSGTTWLADILTKGTNIQHIFEPLHPYWIPEVRTLAGWTKELYRMRLLYLRPDGIYTEWEEFLHRILIGQIRAWGWTDEKRAAHFPDRYLIKEIRANLMLGYLYNTFRLPILYVIRHPCATVLSRLQTKSYCDVRDLLVQESLVEDFLSPWVGKIEKVQDRLDAMAVWWAVENMVALKQLECIPHLLLAYESQVLHPEEEMKKVLAFLGLPDHQHEYDLFQQPSRTSRGAVYASPNDRLVTWKKKLSDEEQERILYWVNLFGIKQYDHSIS